MKRISETIEKLNELEISIKSLKVLTKDQIDTIYIKLAKIYHPDVANNVYSDGIKFIRIKDAQQYLISNIDYVNSLIQNGEINDYYKNNLHIIKEKPEIIYRESTMVNKRMSKINEAKKILETLNEKLYSKKKYLKIVNFIEDFILEISSKSNSMFDIDLKYNKFLLKINKFKKNEKIINKI